jgi:hypothetical protein
MRRRIALVLHREAGQRRSLLAAWAMRRARGSSATRRAFPVVRLVPMLG